METSLQKVGAAATPTFLTNYKGSNDSEKTPLLLPVREAASPNFLNCNGTDMLGRQIRVQAQQYN
jgi:hypothetical protein